MTQQAQDILPHHSQLGTLEQGYRAYVQALQRSAFRGEIETSYGARLIAGTDNSVYQTLPQAILYPRNEADLQLAMQIGSAPEFKSVTFSPRGGGTGTNGQSLTQGIVVDLSRHFNQVLEINKQEGWVRVQTGVVKDQLNDALAPYGWFFSPDLSTSNRATIGGMINTDASGQGSLVYGKTSDHILGLSSILLTGERFTSVPTALVEANKLATEDSATGQIYQQVIASCVAQRAAIEAKFPPLNRFLTGYDLKHAYNPATNEVDVSRLLAGSEGTLGFITEAKLHLTPIPKHKVLVNVKYDAFQSALEHAPFLVGAQATSVETIDSKVLNLARNDIVWDLVKAELSDVEGKTMNGINMVEFTALDAEEMQRKVETLTAALDDFIGSKPEAGVIGYQVCSDATSIKNIYAMRKKAVGLLGATKGARKPCAFAEDTAVPPERLAAFIMDFRAILDDYQLDYGMFGHVDAGVLHVRPALDLKDAGDEAILRQISDKVAALTASYGGLMWGEHGKGYRSEYAPAFFGEGLFTELRKLKAVFDPDNRLNPGKICTPIQSGAALVSVDARKRGYYDRQIPLAVQNQFQPAMDCNGNGLCFNYETTSPMCPSFKATGDRRYSPKGRAGLIREWLRLNKAAGYASELLPYQQGVQLSWWQKQGQPAADDFNAEVKQSMDKCLACKACASQCPVKVDVPSFRAKFLAHYHSKYRRPLKDYFVKTVEQTAPLMAKFPRLSNLLSHNALSRWVLKNVVGYVDAPMQSVPNLQERWQHQGWKTLSAEQVLALNSASREKLVVLVQDPFTSFYEAPLIEDFGRLAQHLGYQPVLLEFIGNGKAQHVKGFLQEFQLTAERVAKDLAKLNAIDVPLVGADTSTVLCFRDEYSSVLPQGASLQVQTLDEWLLQASSASQDLKATAVAQKPYVLLLHCTEKTALPSTSHRWQVIYERFGLAIQPVAVGCCGMAGTFGHELQNLPESKALYEMSWQEVLADHGAEHVLATGFSCRSQVKRLEKDQIMHPLQRLTTHVMENS